MSAAEMGNVLGFVRMMRQAGLRHCSAALCIADGRRAAPDDVRGLDHPDGEEVSIPLPPRMHRVRGSPCSQMPAHCKTAGMLWLCAHCRGR